MRELRLLFDAMDQNWLIASYVTAMFLFTVWVVCQLIQLAWHHAEPHVYLLINFRKEASREVSDGMLPASSRMAATALRTQVGRDVSQRFRARVDEQRYPAGEAASGPAALRSMGTYAPTRDRRAQVGMMPKDAA